MTVYTVSHTVCLVDQPKGHQFISARSANSSLHFSTIVMIRCIKVCDFSQAQITVEFHLLSSGGSSAWSYYINDSGALVHIPIHVDLLYSLTIAFNVYHRCTCINISFNQNYFLTFIDHVDCDIREVLTMEEPRQRKLNLQKFLLRTGKCFCFSEQNNLDQVLGLLRTHKISKLDQNYVDSEAPILGIYIKCICLKLDFMIRVYSGGLYPQETLQVFVLKAKK